VHKIHKFIATIVITEQYLLTFICAFYYEPAMRFFSYIFSIIFLVALFAPLFSYAEPINIALVGHLSTERGQKIIEAVSMQINDFNKSKVIKEEIKLLTYDNLGKALEAKKIAQNIKKQGNVSVILADFSIHTSAAISDFNALEIPIISPSIVPGEHIKSPWFYKTLFSSHTEGVFLASYAKHVYEYNVVDVIYTDDYANTIKQDFSLPFIGIGGKIKNEWRINKNNIENDILNISKKLLAGQHPADAIFLATDAAVAAQIIALIKRKGLIYKIFGNHFLAEDEFIAELSYFPEELYNLGYFSNKVAAVSPLILDIGNEKAQVFKKSFIDLYKRSPNWVEASFFDASYLATFAIRNSQSSSANLPEAIRSFLFSLNEPIDAIDGISGPIYFDSNQERIPQIMVGEYFNQEIISAYTQLYPTDKIQPNLEKSDYIAANNQYLEKINIVFTDIDIIEVSDLDLKTSDYVINFYLSFRYKGDINAKNIEFINQAEHIELGVPFEKITEHGITKESYRIEARFNNPFVFYDYPFDEQELILKFHNKSEYKSNIIYVRDEISMSLESLQDDIMQIQNSKTLEDWIVTNVIFFPDTFKHSFSNISNIQFQGSGSEITRFTVKITIQRNALTFAMKNFLPLLIMLMLIYLVIYTDFATAISVCVGAILATIVEHVRVSGDLPGIGYTVALDYFFYFAYAIIVIEITLCIIIERYRSKSREHISSRITLINKIIYPILLLVSIFLYVYFGLISRNIPTTQVKESSSPIITQQATMHILTLSSWNSDNQDDMDNILSVFAKKHNIKFKFNPIKNSEYFDTLETQLRSGNQPDLFYLPGNEVDAQVLIKEGLTMPLDIPINHTLTEEEQSNWSKDGVMHAIPVHAVSQGVFYNKSIFDKLNISIPFTWEEFIKIAYTLKKSGIIPLANGTREAFANAEILFMGIAPNFIGGPKGRALFEKGSRCFDDDSIIKTFAAIKELVPLLPKNHQDLSAYDARELFIEEKAAMWINGSWELTNLVRDRLRFSLGIFAIPAPKNAKTTILFHYDAAVAVNPKSQHKDLALEFVKWTQTAEYAQLLQDNLVGFFPLMKAPLPKNPYSRAFYNLIKNNQNDSRWILPPGVPSSYQLMGKATSEVLHSNLTPEMAAKYLQAGLSTWYRPAQLCR
jgi:branched-chain amino acid transport system substrate-binding protein